MPDSTALVPLSLYDDSPDKQRRYTNHHKRSGDAIYHMQVWRVVAQMWKEGYTDKQIAAYLQIPYQQIWRYKKAMMDKVLDLVKSGEPIQNDPEPDPYAPRTESARERNWGAGKRGSYRDRQQAQGRRGDRGHHADPGRASGPGVSSQGSGAVSGDVLPGPDERDLQRKIFALRKQAVPMDEIADILGLREEDAYRILNTELQRLEKLSIRDVDSQRLLMVAQLDEMIRAVHAPATGQHPEKGQTAPVLEAMDRLMKLLAQKAKLLGLDAPQKVDIEVSIRKLADEGGYDIEELYEIAQDVLSRYDISGALRG